MNLIEYFQDQVLSQVIAYAVPIVVAAVLGWLAALYARVTGKNMEATHREALQSALTNGLNWAIQQVLDGKLNVDGTIPVSKKAEVLAKAQEYVVSSVPDAVKSFKISQPTMTKLIEAHMPTNAKK